YINQRGDHLDTGDLAHPVQIDHGLISPDDPLPLPGSDLITHAIGVESCHGRNALRGGAPIGLADLNDLAHPTSLPCRLSRHRRFVMRWDSSGWSGGRCAMRVNRPAAASRTVE